jgi:hypothetical protein
MTLAECNDIVEYYEYLDYVEEKMKHPSPKLRVIPLEEWIDMRY